MHEPWQEGMSLYGTKDMPLSAMLHYAIVNFIL